MTTMRLILFLLLVATVMSTNVNLGNIEKKILDQIFSPTTYDKRIRPRSNTTGLSPSPINVTVTMHIIDLILPTEDKQSYGIDIYFREKWLDERLKYDNINGRPDHIVREITLNSVENLWIPDIMFSNEIKGYLHSITTPNMFLRIDSDGQVFISFRLHLQVTAQYNYQKFPFDSQDLQLRLSSYAYKADDVLLQWQQYDPVTINNNMRLPLFSVEKIESIEDIVVAPSGKYSYLKLQITVARRWTYYLLQVYLPCNMLVIVGYLGFWLDIKFITGRVILSVSTLYTMATMISNLNLQLPKVSYARLLDIYTGISLTFVFASLIELVVAQAFENCRCRNKSSSSEEQEQNVKTFNVKHMKQWLKSTPLNKIDAIFRIVYPIAYIAFLILYIIAVLV